MGQCRILTEYRLMSVLVHGGMIAPLRQTYLAYRGPDTRRQRAGWVSPHIVARLKAEKRLQAQAMFPDRLEAAPAPGRARDSRAICRPADLLNLRTDGRRSLMADLFAASASPDVIRQSAAAGRYRDEYIRASQPVADRVRPVFGAGTRRTPSARLAALESGIGTRSMRQLEDLLIDRATVTALTVRWGMEVEGVRAAAQDALARLAVAYELSPAVDTPA
ncbi:hypothetical protein [Hyphomonas sp.]|jgi:hypothetical protein|uniref:hypothetical protein n=1 Tax=Hyphomonas sp. TaxID=87 RepID=UPI0032D8BE62